MLKIQFRYKLSQNIEPYQTENKIFFQKKTAFQMKQIFFIYVMIVIYYLLFFYQLHYFINKYQLFKSTYSSKKLLATFQMIKFNDQLQNKPIKTQNKNSASMLTTQSSEEKSKILSGMQNKKQQSRLQQKQNPHQSLTQDSQIKMFTKMPSYFLQVQQQSIILEENYQTSDHSLKQAQQPKMKKLQTIKCPAKFLNTSNQLKAEKLTKLVYSSQIYIYNQDKSQLQQKNAYIWDRFFCIGDSKINLNQITKIKCLLQAVSPSERKIKIVQNENHLHYFAASTLLCSNSAQKFSQHYLWFSKIICNKIQSIKHLLKYPKTSVFFPKAMPNNSSIQLIKGQIYKKSQHLQNWQLRYIVITQNQLQSYKQNKHTFSIKSEHIKYIWTRFDLYNGYLIIKVKHGLTKTQFGIPIQDYCEVIQGNWVYAFYRLMLNGKNQAD